MLKILKKIKESKTVIRMLEYVKRPLIATLLTALGVAFFAEITNRRSILAAFAFVFTKFHFFLFNFFIVFLILSFSLFFKKRKSVLLLLSMGSRVGAVCFPCDHLL